MINTFLRSPNKDEKVRGPWISKQNRTHIIFTKKINTYNFYKENKHSNWSYPLGKRLYIISLKTTIENSKNTLNKKINTYNFYKENKHSNWSYPLGKRLYIISLKATIENSKKYIKHLSKPVDIFHEATIISMRRMQNPKGDSSLFNW